jgi:hypothetical protein
LGGDAFVLLVLRGLDPRIHQGESFLKAMDCRVKPGNDSKG